MEGQTTQQNITEHVVDDPLAPARLPALAQISDFWKRYDRLADIHDKKMTSNLNENLDVLLIFAALFSAINTTFISITMPDLSPNPSDETNTLLRLLVMKADNNTLTPADLSPPFSPKSTSIVVNCLLYASLSCSLLAAVGAMMSKEWLQSFDRTGQTGPLEEQGRFRQRKFDGVEQWHLEAVIKSLPNLLLLSVILFFAGICLFLFPINTAVAGIVIAFSGLGVILSGISIIAGALSPLCPYQSAASSALLRTARALLSLWGALSPAQVLRRVKGMPGQVSKSFETTCRRCMHFLRDLSSAFTFADSKEDTKKKKENDKVVAAQAAYWLLQTTSNRSDQISAALFMRTLDGEACALASKESGSSPQLVSSVREALDVWYNQPNARNQEVAELFGLALCRARLQSSEVVAPRNDPEDFWLGRLGSFSETFLEVLERTATRFAGCRPEDEEYILHISFLSTILIRNSVIGEYQWAKLSRLILPPTTHNMADGLLGLWAIFGENIGREVSGVGYSYSLGELQGIGENKKRLAKILVGAIFWSDQTLSVVHNNVQSEQSAAQGYTTCLRKVRELPPPSAGDWDAAGRGVADLIRNYFDRLIMGSGPGETRMELVELSVEAVLGLRAFLGTNPGQDKPSTFGRPPSQQFLNHGFIEALTDIMLDKPQIPSGWYRPMKPSLIRVLLWVWKNTPDTSINNEEKDEIFVSSCRFFAPLEKEVAFSERGEFGSQYKPLTSDDLSRIIEFIEYIMKGRKSSAFITRNADVGINRLYAHFDKRAEWEYELFDMHKPSTLCSRFTLTGDGLL